MMNRYEQAHDDKIKDEMKYNPPPPTGSEVEKASREYDWIKNTQEMREKMSKQLTEVLGDLETAKRLLYEMYDQLHNFDYWRKK